MINSVRRDIQHIHIFNLNQRSGTAIRSLNTMCGNLFGGDGVEEACVEAEVSNYNCLGLDEVGPDGLKR